MLLNNEELRIIVQMRFADPKFSSDDRSIRSFALEKAKLATELELGRSGKWQKFSQDTKVMQYAKNAMGLAKPVLRGAHSTEDM